MSYEPSHRMPPPQERWPQATPPAGWPSYRDDEDYRDRQHADSRYAADRQDAYAATAGYRRQAGYQAASGGPGDGADQSALATDTFPPARNGYGSAVGYGRADGYGDAQDGRGWTADGYSSNGYNSNGYSDTANGYGGTRNGYAATGTIGGYPSAVDGYADAGDSFAGTADRYRRTESGYGQAADEYVSDASGYDWSDNGYGSTTDGYDGAVDGYGSATGGYDAAVDAYAGAVDGYGSATGGYDGATADYGGAVDGYAGAGDGYAGTPDGYHGARDEFLGSAAYQGLGSYTEPGLSDPRLVVPDAGVDPYRWQADQDARREAGRRGLGVGAVTGFLAAAVAIGVSTLAAGFLRPQASPMAALDSVFINRTPAALKNVALQHFGTNGRTVLLLGMYAAIAVLAVGIGLLARRATVSGVACLAAFSLLAAFVTITRPGGRVSDVAPAVIGGIAGIAALLWLIQASAPPQRVAPLRHARGGSRRRAR